MKTEDTFKEAPIYCDEGGKEHAFERGQVCVFCGAQNPAYLIREATDGLVSRLRDKADDAELNGKWETPDLLREAADALESKDAEIERLRGMNEMLRESVAHLRCKNCGDNDFEPESPAGACAECDLWR